MISYNQFRELEIEKPPKKELSPDDFSNVFEDNEDLCRKYLRNSSRYRHLAKPAFNKTERAIEKVISSIRQKK